MGQSQCPGFTRSEEPVPLVQKQDGSGVAFLGRLLRGGVSSASMNALFYNFVNFGSLITSSQGFICHHLETTSCSDAY